jgi:hypothetical protein
LRQFISDNTHYLNHHCNPSFVGFAIEKDNFTLLYKMMYSYLREV